MAMGGDVKTIQTLVLERSAAYGGGEWYRVARLRSCWRTRCQLLFGVKVAEPIAFIVIPLSWQPWPRWLLPAGAAPPCAWIRIAALSTSRT